MGKRVKCPGCGKPVEVPGAEAASADTGASLDLSLLDDSMSGGESSAKPRKLRSIAVGCGVCSKTIHIPENRKGAVTPCPKCRTPLLVDVPELPETSGSTIDFKHLALDPASEPSLLGDSLAGGSLASLTSTGSLAGRTGRSGRGGTTGGSRLGATGSFASAAGTGISGGATNSKDQMQELRSLNDLKASGAISDDEYRKRKAAIYSGSPGSGAATGARAAMSRNASGASERAIKVDMGLQIPGPIKLLAGVGVFALGGFLVWQYGIQPALQGPAQPQVAEVEAPTPSQTDREAALAEQAAEEARQAEEAARLAAEEAETVTWASLIPDLGPEAMEVVFVQPGRPGPAEDPSIFAMDEASETGADSVGDPALASLPSALDESPGATPPPRSRGARSARSDGPAEISYWDVMLPEGRTTHPLASKSDFTYRLDRLGQTAYIGVGLGPAVTGLDDDAFRKWERNEIQQSFINGLARQVGFENARPRTIDRPQTVQGVVYHEMTLEGSGADRGKRSVLLTGVQDGYAIHYWFAGHARLYAIWKREALGKAVIE
ncbi:MAG: SHOCT domain-containing protein [Planctomycetota bacterium]